MDVSQQGRYHLYSGSYDFLENSLSKRVALFPIDYYFKYTKEGRKEKEIFPTVFSD